jgi:hypothetical protein
MLRKTIAFLGVTFALICPGAAEAHVKWFMPYDLTQPPRPSGR